MKKQMIGLLLSLTTILNYSCITNESETTPSTKLNITNSKKLSYYTDSYEAPEVGFKPQQKVKFEYNADGELIKKIVYGFDPTNNQVLVELNYFTFAHSNGLVTKITGYTTGKSSPNVEYVYEYLPDNTLSVIHDTNYAAGINSTVNFLYDTSANKVRAAYTYSNGENFSYDFFLNNKNIIGDRTVKGADLCNVGEYTYDDGINPFSQVGYVEYDLSNYSINNRLSENVNYIGCAFPSLVPQKYTYVYDNQGYPIVATTVYASGKQSQRIFIYK